MFVDVGAFSVLGDGAGIRPDIGRIYFPQFAGKIAGEWVFMGDPFATAVNSLGQAADTANSLEDATDALTPNRLPTAPGHVRWNVPNVRDFVVGASAAYGPQDLAPKA